MASTEPPPLITECPNCHTRFRVGESQLQIAHGRVRCGACLAVFAGVDHLLLDDSMPAPELPSETNMLESVLAELAEEESAAADVASSEDMGVTAARAYELETLAARRGDSRELELSDGFLAAEAALDTEEEITLESAEDADWTSVAVDTQEFGPRVTLELAGSGTSRRFEDAPEEPKASRAEPRVTIEDALQDEEALRWWLEDELPGEADEPADDDDALVVQLSELDAVRDDDLDLRELLATPDNGSKGQLEALFRELREEQPGGGVPEEAASEDEAGEMVVGSFADEETVVLVDDDVDADPLEPELSGEQALREVVSELKADAESAEASNRAAEVAGAGTERSAETASERSAAELHEAIDQAEPLVTRAMANGALVASANKVAETERAAEAEQAVARHRLADRAEPPAPAADDRAAIVHTAKAATDGAEVAETLATGRGVELVEPPPERQAAQAQGWNSESFPETPAELVENITAEMAAAGSATSETDDAGESGDSLWARVKEGLERLLGNPYALRVGTILATVLLVGQIMFWQFDEWAKSPALRPVYSGICAAVGCELPLRRSVQDMQSRKLAVRSHPEKPGKLLVDALIINEAEFEQPFPIIELQFMDLNQQVVGSYRLEPGSYLDGELAGNDGLMAIRTPVHIDIEIEDPGPTAVNYQLQFR